MIGEKVAVACVDDTKLKGSTESKVRHSVKRNFNKPAVWAKRNLAQFVKEKCKVLHLKQNCIGTGWETTGLTWTGPGRCGGFLNCCILKGKPAAASRALA